VTELKGNLADQQEQQGLGAEVLKGRVAHLEEMVESYQKQLQELQQELASSREAVVAAELKFVAPLAAAGGAVALELDSDGLESGLVEELREELAGAKAATAAAEQRALELATELAVAERKARNTAERLTMLAEADHKAEVGGAGPIKGHAWGSLGLNLWGLARAKTGMKVDSTYR
jgi:hypothetical protein